MDAGGMVLGGMMLTGAAALAALVHLALVPDRRSKRVRVWQAKSAQLSVPPVCVVTGEPATRHCRVTSFNGTPYGLSETGVDLPFSDRGWEEYRAQYPVSLAIFRSPLHGCLQVPAFGPYFAIYLWTWLAGPICGLIAVWDLIRNRRKLVAVHAVRVHDGRICGLDVSAPSEAFVREFERLNATDEAPVRWWQFWR